MSVQPVSQGAGRSIEQGVDIPHKSDVETAHSSASGNLGMLKRGLPSLVQIQILRGRGGGVRVEAKKRKMPRGKLKEGEGERMRRW